MLTQAIKGWLQKVFAWWPWKQSTPIEYPRVSTVTRGPTPETTLRATREGIIPQAGVTPRRFPLEGRAERMAHPRSEAPDLPALLSSAPFAGLDAESTEASAGMREHVPTTRQRLEFLRYLVQRGIVNEGFEDDLSDSSR